MQKEVLLNTKITSGVRTVLRNEGYVLFDMHYHTNCSDGVASVNAALKKAMKLGVGLAITDHNEIQGAVLASQQHDVMIIPGMEVTCQEGMHVLLYFYNIKEYIAYFEQHIKPLRTHHESSFTFLPFETLMKTSAKANCIVAAAHPYGIGWTGIMKKKHKNIVTPQLLKKFDAIEGLNGSSMRDWNKKAHMLALTLDKPVTGGSDGHTLREMGHVLMYAKAKNPRTFLDAVKKKQACVIGRETNLIYNVGSQMVKIKNVSSAEEMVKRKINGIINTINGHKTDDDDEDNNDDS
jgi:predicted metal-dependent phosphoesterase TrpH